MGKNNYNDNNEAYSELISDLKNLPKVNAPDNFEYNLMIKIQNGNFNIKEEKSSKKMLYWFLTPASAIASLMLVFFFVTRTAEQIDENLLMANPLPISEYSGSNDLSINSVFGYQDGSYKTVLKENDVVTRERVEYQFDKSRSLAVDNYIGAAPVATGGNQNYHQVGGAQPRRTIFDGFQYIGNVKQKDLLELKSRRDSILNEINENQIR